MKKVIVIVAAAAGAAYAKRRHDQQQSERDLYAATSRMTSSTRGNASTGAWAAATDRRS